MNKLYLRVWAIPFVLTAFLAYACQKDQNLFKETPAERTTQAMTEALTALQSAEHGWEMSIFPSADQRYGGYTILVKFDKDGYATLADELQDDPQKTSKGHYTLDNSNGPTLVFDTYAEPIHRYSEPNSPDFPKNKAFGADGDLVFRIIRASKDKIVLKGVRTNSETILTPLKSTDWKGLLESHKSASKRFHIAKPVLSIHGEKALGGKMTSTRHLSFVYKEKKYDVAYRYTASGIAFAEPLELEDLKIESLINKGTGDEVMLTDSSGKFVLSAK